ncbi:hypothetical protein C1645_830209 [Glomus cerebriforme]|uniref:Uncharacterized protein n=1 Tax=Glomus cerebriforme TaxID=658196 RepID=A0A397SHR4_9GLOM|nr:hypothetical protein C1645_830209 [Glomus cerebriforme]
MSESFVEFANILDVEESVNDEQNYETNFAERNQLDVEGSINDEQNYETNLAERCQLDVEGSINVEQNYETNLAERCQLDLNEIPQCLRQNAERILEVFNRIAIDDPIIVIDWTNPWPRRGRRQNKRILINHIINNGGRNEYNSDMIFSFRTNHDLANCINLFPLWSRHDRTNTSPDVGHMYRVNKVTERIADMEDSALLVPKLVIA